MNAFETIPVVLVGDPAVEWPEDEAGEAAKDAYLKSYDITLLKIRPGQQPVKFWCKALPESFVLSMGGVPGLPDTNRQLECFRIGCHKVTLADGSEIVADEKKMQPATQRQRRAGDEWVNRVARKVGGGKIVTVGGVIENRAYMTEEERGSF